ncbi:MAG TPA: ribonuclease J [Clostridiales bacterium]|nr:ribonuclease J [Clostridiales bacterium]
MAKNLKIIMLGGVEEIGKNLTIFEYDDTMIIVDVGMSFPDNEVLPGVEYIIPDFSYILERIDKLKAIFLTHGHEDHIGAMPILLKHVDVPVYGSNIALGFLENKLTKNKLKKKTSNFHKVNEHSKPIKVGPFTVEFIRVTHSIPGAFSLWIKTPKGGVFYTGDFKIDHTPVDSRSIELSRIAEIGKEGVLLLMSDSTNANKPGYSLSELEVGKNLSSIFNDKSDDRITVATFASNVHRIQQIYDCAVKFNRKVVLMGRSLKNNVELAEKYKELKFEPKNIIELSEAMKLPMNKVCIIATGSQGEPRSALYKMSVGDSSPLVIGEKDTIILSARSIPGNEKTIYKMINGLSRLGADVIYQTLYNVHCSGHACQEELKLMMALTSPSYFVPIHGEFRHMLQHERIAISMGMPKKNILIPTLGSSFEISKKGFIDKGKVPCKSVYMIGDQESETDEIEIRRFIAEEGVVVISASIDNIGLPKSDIQIVAKGIVLSDSLIIDVASSLYKFLDDGNVVGLNSEEIESEIIRFAKRKFRNTMKRTPFIIPVIQMEERDI